MKHLWHLTVVLLFPVFFLTAFVLWLWFLRQEYYGDDYYYHYTLSDIIRIGWRAYES